MSSWQILAAMSPAKKERRRSTRRSTGFPVEVIGGVKTRIGFTRNTSPDGVLCFSRGALPEGEPVVVRFRDPRRPGNYLRVRGRVVRCGRDVVTDIWPHQLAIALEEPLAE